MTDVQDSLKNANEDALANPSVWGLTQSVELPEWAKRYLDGDSCVPILTGVRLTQVLEDLCKNTKLSDEVTGAATSAAVKTLLANCKNEMPNNGDGNLIHNIDEVIALLVIFKSKAQSQLPINNGGLAGKNIQYWVDYLKKEAGIDIYESEYLPGYFGFSGCSADQYNSETEAVVAALQERVSTLTVEWEQEVGETDENRNFSDWLTDKHPVLATGF